MKKPDESEHPNREEHSRLTDEEIQELVSRPSSLRPDVQVSVLGLKEELGRAVGEDVVCLIRILSTTLNLERLERVVIALDYEQALRDVDRGTNYASIPAPTRDEFVQGVAMAVKVMRDEEVRVCVVLNAAYVYAISDPENADHGRAFNLVSHECGHVHLLPYLDKTYQGLYFRPAIRSFRERLLESIALFSWDEYGATRLSSAFDFERVRDDFESTFCNVLSTTKERGNRFIRDYRLHGDTERLMNELDVVYGGLLRHTAYLLGHVSESNQPFEQVAPKAHAAMLAHPFFIPLFTRFKIALENLWANYKDWADPSVLDELKQVAQDVVEEAGIRISDRPGGAAYIDVPFTFQTMPFS